MAKVITFRVDDDEKVELDRFCKRHKMTLSEMIRDAIREYKENHKGQVARKKSIEWDEE